MIKTIDIGDKEIQLDNNIGWTLIYRDQFETDIIPALMPVFASVMDIVSDLIKNTGKTEDIDPYELIAQMDGDTLMNAVIHLSGLEFVDFLHIIWALAKNADDTIPEPRKWYRQFEESFPLDEIVPEVAKLIARGVVSSKNLERLNDLKKTVQKKKVKSTSTQSFSPVLKEV